MMTCGTLLQSLVALVTVAAAAAPPRTASTFPPEKILEAIAVQPGGTVCEIGAGEGDTSLAIARILGPAGRVYTSELGENRLARLRSQVAGSGLETVTVVPGDSVKTNFPEGACDGVFMRDVYHHFTEPASIDKAIFDAIKPGGRVAVIDFRPPGQEADQPAGRAKGGTHGVTPETVSRELRQAGLDPVSSQASGERWFMVVHAKPKQ
jgi:ubiquinone/menaquinone biosynthesis C-methylase UbiE